MQKGALKSVPDYLKLDTASHSPSCARPGQKAALLSSPHSLLVARVDGGGDWPPGALPPGALTGRAT